MHNINVPKHGRLQVETDGDTPEKNAQKFSRTSGSCIYFY